MTKHEQDPTSQSEAGRSKEELENGFYLDPDEIVAFEARPDPDSARRPYHLGYGVETEPAAPVAEIRIGGVETFATGTVLNLRDSERSEDRKYIFCLSSRDGKRPFATALKRGELLGIGRDQEGQDDLPDTVSHDHCAVGLDEEGRLVIENHQPTNYTAVVKR